MDKSRMVNPRLQYEIFLGPQEQFLGVGIARGEQDRLARLRLHPDLPNAEACPAADRVQP
jgi:hypothetical protein